MGHQAAARKDLYVQAQFHRQTACCARHLDAACHHLMHLLEARGAHKHCSALGCCNDHTAVAIVLLNADFDSTATFGLSLWHAHTALLHPLGFTTYAADSKLTAKAPALHTQHVMQR